MKKLFFFFLLKRNIRVGADCAINKWFIIFPTLYAFIQHIFLIIPTEGYLESNVRLNLAWKRGLMARANISPDKLTREGEKPRNVFKTILRHWQPDGKKVRRLVYKLIIVISNMLSFKNKTLISKLYRKLFFHVLEGVLSGGIALVTDGDLELIFFT